MTVIPYVVRPLSDRTAFTGRHKPSPFASDWTSTEELLSRELRNLAARDVVVELDLLEGQIRNDGRPYAKAKTASAAIRIAFESRFGPLTYATDVFPTWQDNVRAVALSLEALRRVDRYGVVKRGEQYAGFKALPAGSGATASHMTRDEALEEIAFRVRIPVANLNTNPDVLRNTWRRARRAVHPDHNGGAREAWDRIEAAGAVLGVSS